MTPITFTVRGGIMFPLDMLRHDACYPKSPEDASKLYTMIINQPVNEHFEITLVSHANFITPGRWASFGWTVVQCHPYRVTGGK